MKSLALRASAKINAFLKVGSRRADGFHSLRTEFQEISLHDTLRFRVTEAPVLHLSVSDSRLPVNSDNLVIRALASLRLKLRVHAGMSVHLNKKIPVGAGLGGGSSDAAAALWAGWLLWKKRPVSDYRRRIPPVLKKLAASLGSDVSFFLKGGRAIGRGKGEILAPVATLPVQWMVLVYPRVHVSTPKAYGWLDQDRKKMKTTAAEQNDFERPVFKRVPMVARVKRRLASLGCGPVLMSGSGSSVFGFVKTPSEGRRVIRSLRRSDWDSFLVRTI